MIDVIDIIGTHVWEIIVEGDHVFVVPDLNWCIKALLLLFSVYIFIKTTLGICRMFT